MCGTSLGRVQRSSRLPVRAPVSRAPPPSPAPLPRTSACLLPSFAWLFACPPLALHSVPPTSTLLVQQLGRARHGAAIRATAEPAAAPAAGSDTNAPSPGPAIPITVYVPDCPLEFGETLRLVGESPGACHATRAWPASGGNSAKLACFGPAVVPPDALPFPASHRDTTAAVSHIPLPHPQSWARGMVVRRCSWSGGRATAGSRRSTCRRACTRASWCWCRRAAAWCGRKARTVKWSCPTQRQVGGQAGEAERRRRARRARRCYASALPCAAGSAPASAADPSLARVPPPTC